MNIIRHSLSPFPAAVAQLRRSVSLTRSADFQSLLEADIYCHGLVSALGFEGRGQFDQDGTDWSVRLPDQFAADDHHGFDFREDQMSISEDGIPNNKGCIAAERSEASNTALVEQARLTSARGD